MAVAHASTLTFKYILSHTHTRTRDERPFVPREYIGAEGGRPPGGVATRKSVRRRLLPLNDTVRFEVISDRV